MKICSIISNTPINYRFYKTIFLNQILLNSTYEIMVENCNILLCNYENKIYALQNLCTHQDQKLSGGCLYKGKIICPFHGASFDLMTGELCDPPAIENIKTFPVRIVDKIIEVAIPINTLNH